MQAARERRCNGMVHTLSPASLPSGAIARRTKELNSVDADMAIRLAALTKAAFKGKLPPQQPHRKNGFATNSHPPTIHPPVVPKTEASPTPGLAPLTIQSTPHSLISRHCSTLVHSRNSNADATHTTIDHKLSSSLNRLRQKQLILTHRHARRQIEAYTHQQLLSETTDEIELDSSSLCAQNDMARSYLDLPFSPSLPKVVTKMTPSVSDTVRSLQLHLECLESFVDDEMTCSSSDDEEEVEERGRGRERRNEVKRRWEQHRTVLGSEWAWLCHQVTSINQQIRHLNSHLQSCPPKNPISLTSPALLTTLPCVCKNKQDNTQVSNGITPSLHKTSGGPISSIKSITTPNGVCSPCPCQLRQMLLANSNGTTPHFRVQELLGCSFPVLLMEESTLTCARTRSLQLTPPQRKLVRIKKNRREGGRSLDKCHHPQLSHLGDYPSSLWLDSALHQILQEHSYASLPQIKRRKITSSSSLVSMFNTPVSRSIIRMERSRSFSPSPSSFDGSAERGIKGVPRKRNSTHLSFSGDSDSRPATPTLPLASRKKRGVGTPSFDIDNIVIPYSIACSTRLEKLEYKEIVTPKWREIDSTPAAAKLANGDGGDVKVEDEKSVEGIGGRSHKPRASRKLELDPEDAIKKEKEEGEDVEDTSAEAFLIRHGKCEAVERKRYLNFITGSTRKRSRPSTQSSTPDSAHSPASFTGGDLELTFLPQVLPWPSRRFPLVGKSLSELTNPSSPPHRTICSSPILSADHSNTTMSYSPLTHISTSSTSPNQHNTPVNSPGPLSEECPLAVTSSHWVITATPANKPSIVLKLTKRS